MPVRFLLFLCAFTLGSLPVTGQIIIVQPSSPIRVAPGATIALELSISSPMTFSAISVLGDLPVLAYPLVKNPSIVSPLRLSMSVSPNAAWGRYRLLAMGRSLTSSALAISDSLSVIVEGTGAVTAISSEIRSVVLRYPGDQAQLSLSAVVGGALQSISESSDLTLQIRNSGVAVVSSGLVRAVGKGETTIDAQFRGISLAIPVAVSASIKGDYDGDGDVDQDDLNILIGFNGELAAKPLDWRDLNNDGKIDALDSRIAVGLCTRPRCSTTTN